MNVGRLGNVNNNMGTAGKDSPFANALLLFGQSSY